MAGKAGIPKSVIDDMGGWGNPYMAKIYTHLPEQYFVDETKKMDQKPPVLDSDKGMKPEIDVTQLSAESIAKVAQAIKEELKRRKQAS